MQSARCQATALAGKMFERSPFIGGGIVEQDDDLAAHMAEQLRQKGADLLLPDALINE